jgi:hypothetical protein
MSRQISAIVRNASSRLDFSDNRSFSFGEGSFGLRGSALLAIAVFDSADDFVAVTGRDLRFGVTICWSLADFLASVENNSSREAD